MVAVIRPLVIRAECFDFPEILALAAVPVYVIREQFVSLFAGFADSAVDLCQFLGIL